MASTEAEVCCTNATFAEKPEEVEGWCEDLSKKSGVLPTGHQQLDGTSDHFLMGYMVFRPHLLEATFANSSQVSYDFLASLQVVSFEGRKKES